MSKPSLPPALVEALAGAAGAIIAISATYPLIQVNTMQQVSQKQKGVVTAKTNFWSTLQQIIKEDGSVKGVFRGWPSMVFSTGISQLVYFYFYAIVRDIIVNLRRKPGTAALKAGEKGNVSALEALGVASLAGCINVVVTSPIWVVTSRIQVMKKKQEVPPADGASTPRGDKGAAAAKERRATMLSVVREVYADNGIMGFWKGVLPSLAMVSNPACQYMIFEWLSTQRARLEKHRRNPTSGQIFMMGALAKTGATLVTYPMLLVKSRLQAESKHSTYKYNGTIHAINSIAKTEGWGAFYEGMGSKIVQSVLGAALMFVLKDKIDRSVTKLLLGDTAVKAKVKA